MFFSSPSSQTPPVYEGSCLLVCDSMCYVDIVSIATGYGLDVPGIESWCM